MNASLRIYQCRTRRGKQLCERWGPRFGEEAAAAEVLPVWRISIPIPNAKLLWTFLAILHPSSQALLASSYFRCLPNTANLLQLEMQAWLLSILSVLVLLSCPKVYTRCYSRSLSHFYTKDLLCFKASNALRLKRWRRSGLLFYYGVIQLDRKHILLQVASKPLLDASCTLSIPQNNSSSHLSPFS